MIRTTHYSALVRVLAVAAALLVFKVTASVLVEYRHYFPPNFHCDFLRGREAYFWGAYRFAFYAHLASGPAALVLGTVLVSERFRTSAPLWHRRLGCVQVACILLLVAPSGLWMSWYAETGAIAGAGLASLAVATAACATLGWRAAVARRFDQHRRWMWRTYLLLCSAVVIRLMGGLATMMQFEAEWFYAFSAWASWLLPLAVFESWRLVQLPASD